MCHNSFFENVEIEDIGGLMKTNFFIGVYICCLHLQCSICRTYL